MFTTTTVAALLWYVLLPLVVIIALVDLLTESDSDKARRLRRNGLSQAKIAAEMGITRYRVRKLLAA